MKKYGYIAIVIVAVGILAGCSKTEVNLPAEKEISFAVGSYASRTKAPAGLDDVDGGISAFSSKGFLHAEGYEGQTQDFFGSSGETISWKSAGSVWTPSHPYYWPKSSESYINFVSWYDKNGAPDSPSETSVSWTFDGVGRTLATDDNLMIADEAWRYNANTTNALQYEGDAVLSGVPTLFHHLLAKISFRVRVSEVLSNVTITVRNFSLTGVYTTGTLALSNSDPASGPQTRAWTGGWSFTGETAGSVSGAASLTPGTSWQFLLGETSVLPQDIDDIRVVFSYDISTQIDSNNAISETVPVSIALSDFGIVEMLMNQKITCSITINPALQQISIDPAEIEAWVNETEQTIVVNE